MVHREVHRGVYHDASRSDAVDDDVGVVHARRGSHLIFEGLAEGRVEGGVVEVGDGEATEGYVGGNQGLEGNGGCMCVWGYRWSWSREKPCQ